MKMRWISAFALMTLIAMNVYAGRLVPIQQYSGTTDLPTMADIEACIIAGGIIPGPNKWSMEVKEPGHIVGTIIIREYTVVVDINYDMKKYTITYKDSQNLPHEGNLIHGKYNTWAHNLSGMIDKKIMERRNAIAAAKAAATQLAPTTAPASVPAAAPAAAPETTPAAQPQQSVEERLQKLQELFEKGLITEDEFKTRKETILKEI
jgi:hypothetical protein